MLRFLTLTAFLAGALLFTHGAAQAQDQDLPLAGPDEIVLVGRSRFEQRPRFVRNQLFVRQPGDQRGLFGPSLNTVGRHVGFLIPIEELLDRPEPTDVLDSRQELCIYV